VGARQPLEHAATGGGEFNARDALICLIGNSANESSVDATIY